MSNKQQQYDLAFIANVIRDYQNTNGHGDITIKFQNGRVVLIEETKRHKPTGVNND